MKIYIGKYCTYTGPYQIAKSLRKIGVSEDRCDALGKWLGDTWVANFCEWIHSKQKRNVKIRIDDYDVWNMDATLALIILPMLKKLKEKKHGSAMVDDADVPEHIKSTSAAPYEEWQVGTDEFVHDRWDYVLNEMIFAFEFMHPDSQDDIKRAYDPELNKRSENGLRLFGKYFRGLWD